jgi:glucose-6-phosphate isomerase
MEYYKNFYQIKSNEEIFNEIKKERNYIGYYNLPFLDISDIKNFTKKITKKHIIVIGIGGSTIGTKAIYEFLLTSNSYKKKLHFLETTDPLDINHKLDLINLNEAYFLIVSKSGCTIETISIFKYISSLIKIDKNNSLIISDNKNPLSIFANKQNIKLFNVGESVGGRFSVFSAVGLIPLAIIGVNIDELLNGCKEVYESFFSKKKYYDLIIQKARFFVENKNRFNINIVLSYLSSLEGFNKWYVQLWGESLGKLNINKTRQGLTPIGLIGPNDQHSFLQLIMDGNRDKTITFIKVRDFKDKTKIPKNTLNGFNELDYVDGVYFQDLINKQADSIISSIDEQKDIPYDIITIKRVDEYSIAQLMFMYQILTSCVGKFVQINTYNQPGVENGKNILKKILK